MGKLLGRTGMNCKINWLELSRGEGGCEDSGVWEALLRLLAAVPRAAGCPSSSHGAESGDKRVA